MRSSPTDGSAAINVGTRIVSEPFRKVVESDGSVVAQGGMGGHRACGLKITVGPQIVEDFGIPARRPQLIHLSA